MKQYNAYINQFKQFCVSNNINFPPNEQIRSATIANFLLYKSEQSMRPESMLKSIRAALTQYFNSIGVTDPFCSQLKQFNTALIKCQTTKPKGRTPIMPIKPFMEMFEKWPINEKLTTADLRLKAVTLLTISTLARCSDLAPANVLKRSQLRFNSDNSLTINMFGIKNDSNRTGFEIRVEKSNNVKCDPVSCLEHYIQRTKHQVDSSIDPLFIKPTAPHDPVSPRGIADILRSAIKKAGLSDLYTPRCFRPSATSAAIFGGCEHESVRQLGRWKTRETFYENYVYPIRKDNTTDKILNSDLNIY